MTPRAIASGVVLSLSLVPIAARAQGHPLRIEEAVQLALERNEQAKIAGEQVLVADAAVQRARAGFLPTLVAAGADTLRPDRLATPGGPGLPGNVLNGSAVLNQPIVNAPAWPLYRQAERLLDAQRATTIDVKRLLAFNAANAFFATLSAEEVLQAAGHRVDAAKANLADAQARVDAQLNSSNDVTRAELDLASAQQEVANDTGALERAYLQLAFVINGPVAPPLLPPTATLQAAGTEAGRADDLVPTALSRRPDLVAARHSARAAHLFADEPLLRTVPTLGLAAGVTATSNSPTAASRAVDGTVAATMTWTLYDAGVRYADLHSREASARISDLQVDLLERAINNDVHLAAASLASAQAAFHVSEAAVEASRKSVDETATLYRQGLAKAIELTDANDARFVAEVGHVSAEFAMAQAYLALRQAMGLDPLGTVLR